jgi:regulator of replication initiation timing
MAFSNNPTDGEGTSREELQSPKRSSKGTVISGILVAALLATWGYLLYDKNKSSQQITQLNTQTAQLDSQRNVVTQEYNDALKGMDSLIGNSKLLTGQLAEKNRAIDSLKERIKSELYKKNGDLNKARAMIADLKTQVDGLLAQVEQLKTENTTLKANNETLTKQRDTLTTQNASLNQDLATTTQEKQHIEDEASTLHASNFNIIAIKVNGSGKESETSKAKRADMLRISFDLDENRISRTGTKELYLIITNPDGVPITIPSEGSGSFTTRQEGDKAYTTKVSVNYEQGKRIPVTYDWKQDGHYVPGDYKIAIYHNGYKIGEGTKTLKKGGLFG